MPEEQRHLEFAEFEPGDGDAEAGGTGADAAEPVERGPVVFGDDYAGGCGV